MDTRTEYYGTDYKLQGDKVGPRHHGMARPQVADVGTASNMENSCEYIE